MKIVCIVGLLATIFQTLSPVNSAVAIGRPNPARKPGGCYEADVGHLKKGVTITVPRQCVSASCEGNGSIYYASCGVIGVSGNCYISEPDLTKKYPDCCPKPVCRS